MRWAGLPQASMACHKHPCRVGRQPRKNWRRLAIVHSLAGITAELRARQGRGLPSCACRQLRTVASRACHWQPCLGRVLPQGSTRPAHALHPELVSLLQGSGSLPRCAGTRSDCARDAICA